VLADARLQVALRDHVDPSFEESLKVGSGQGGYIDEIRQRVLAVPRCNAVTSFSAWIMVSG